MDSTPAPAALPARRLVTISATYGAGGSVVAPALAARLNVPFYDRLLHGPETRTAAAVAERLSEEEKRLEPPGRVMAGLAHIGLGLGFPSPPLEQLQPHAEIRRQAEENVARIYDAGRGVLLGRGSSVVLHEQPGVFHVRLDGALERRVQQGMQIESIERSVAERHQRETDRAWRRFVELVYDADPAQPSWYHLMIDSTVLPLAAVVDLVASAATAFWAFARERPQPER